MAYDMAENHKKIYEGLQAVNSLLNAEGEGMLVKLVEDIRTALRSEEASAWPYANAGSIGATEVILGSWVEYDAAERPLDPVS